VNFPLEMSVGYQVRMTHRALQRYLQGKIEPYGVTLGMWYFLRALWHEDGLTQRELSRRIGTMEPTTLNAILTMERSGLVKRVRNKVDKRKIHVHLTPKGRKLKDELLPLAVSVVNTATKTLSSREITTLLKMLSSIRANLGLEGAGVDE
jgi:DNA-binding MarR family transcriptional regulator